jgi:hypothetical protein
MISQGWTGGPLVGVADQAEAEGRIRRSLRAIRMERLRRFPYRALS